MKREPPDELRQEHIRLRAILADHKPVTYGTLRTDHGFQPSRLEYAYQTFPEVFAAGTTPEGRPTIWLLDTEAEAFDDLWLRQKLVRLVKRSGDHGTLLKTLYRSSEIESKTIKRLLALVAGIEVTRRPKGQILYRWIGTPEKTVEESRIQDSQPAADPLPEPVGGPDADLELTRQKLVVLCGKNHRHLSWLANFLDPVLIRRVLERWPQDFETQVSDLGGAPDLIIRVKFSSDAGTAPPVAADVLVPSAPQVSGPSAPLEEIFDAEMLEELRFKPPCVGMGARRNGRAIVRGDRIVKTR
jgi:hypothetical protein